MSYSKIHLEPDSFYHIIHHAVADENIFKQEHDYPIFLEKILKYVEPVCDIYAYCLMCNHCHFVLKIKPESFLKQLWGEAINFRLKRWLSRQMLLTNVDLSQNETQIRIQTAEIIEKMISEQFSNCFNSYVQTTNRLYNRKGPLFDDSFTRILIDSDDYLRTCICYVHNNPVLDEFTDAPEKWTHSSFNLFSSKEPAFVKREEVLELFGGFENFHFAHREHLTLSGSNDSVKKLHPVRIILSIN